MGVFNSLYFLVEVGGRGKGEGGWDGAESASNSLGIIVKI